MTRIERVLWDAKGARRVPSEAAFDQAATTLRKGALERLCEFDPRGPLYFIPTSRWLRALVKTLHTLKARKVLEVAAGDGFLSACLQRAAPVLEVIASDSGAWEKPRARMNATERSKLAGKAVPGLPLGPDVVRMNARDAVLKFQPDLVVACWLPPGLLLDQIIRSPVKHVLEIGAAGGVTSSQWSWRFNHEFLDGPLEKLARCRLDERPKRVLHTRATLYYGAAHPEHSVERVRPGDWLWQFRPR